MKMPVLSEERTGVLNVAADARPCLQMQRKHQRPFLDLTVREQPDCSPHWARLVSSLNPACGEEVSGTSPLQLMECRTGSEAPDNQVLPFYSASHANRVGRG